MSQPTAATQARQFFAQAGDHAKARWQEVGGFRGIGAKVSASTTAAKEHMKDLSSKVSCHGAHSQRPRPSMAGAVPTAGLPSNVPPRGGSADVEIEADYMSVQDYTRPAQYRPRETLPEDSAGPAPPADSTWEQLGGWAGIGERAKAAAKATQEQAKELDEKHRITDKVKEGLAKTGAQLHSSSQAAQARAKGLDKKYDIRFVDAAFTSADRRMVKKTQAGAENFLAKMATIRCA